MQPLVLNSSHKPSNSPAVKSVACTAARIPNGNHNANRLCLAAVKANSQQGNLDLDLKDTRYVHLEPEDKTYKVLAVDYGFRTGIEQLYSGQAGEIPENLFILSWDNLKKEYAHLRRSFRYDEYNKFVRKNPTDNLFWKVIRKPGEVLVRVFAGIDVFLEAFRLLPRLDPNPSPEQVEVDRNESEQRKQQAKDIRQRLAALELDIDAIWERHNEREADPNYAGHKTNWFINGIYLALCVLLDNIYKHRPIERFWLNETVARMPYFAYISMLHLYESLGWWRAGAELRKVHFAEEANELHHLMIMESLGGDQLWFDRFFAQHCAVFYFWAIILAFVFSPSNAYIFSELVEMHATDTYGQFLDQNEAALKALPPPQVALEYYKARDMYLFDAMHMDDKQQRRPSCNNLYEVFKNILDDEGEHVKVMASCRDTSIVDVIASRMENEGAGAQRMSKAGRMDRTHLT